MKLSVRPRQQPDINLTSLIDVVLLLLIFFMVSTSFIKPSQIQVRLPETAATTAQSEVPPESIDIMISETGTVFMNGRELINNRPETIRNALRKVSGGDNKLPLTISADANAKHQFVVTAMDVAGRLGFQQVNIATVNAPTDEDE